MALVQERLYLLNFWAMVSSLKKVLPGDTLEIFFRKQFS
jgi:hypothetical protein